MTAYKFTDRDIRRNPELILEAIRYLKWYTGDFEFLRNVQRGLLADGTLSVPLARAVMNCARIDPEWDIAPLHDDDDDEGEPRRLHVVREERKVVHEPYNLNVTWHTPFLSSTHKSAQVYHLLSAERSFIRVFPAASSDSRLRVMMYAQCPWHAWEDGTWDDWCATRKNGARLLLTPPDDRRLCRTCEEIG